MKETITALKNLMVQDPVAHALFASFKTRERGRNATTIDRAQHILQHSPLKLQASRDDIRRTFQVLDAIGVGKLFTGRGGAIKAITWKHDIIKLAEMAFKTPMNEKPDPAPLPSFPEGRLPPVPPKTAVKASIERVVQNRRSTDLPARFVVRTGAYEVICPTAMSEVERQATAEFLKALSSGRVLRKVDNRLG